MDNALFHHQESISSALMVATMLFEPWPIWLARYQDSSLEGLPLALSDGKRITAVSLEARHLGIEIGMKLTGAKVLLPELVVLPSNTQAQEQAWGSLVEELYGFSNRVEPLCQGRVLLKTSMLQGKQLAEAYKARVGIAQHREVSVLAGLAARVGEPRVIPMGQERAFLGALPLYFLRGLGLSERSLQDLYRLGLKQVGQVMAWKPKQFMAFVEEALTLKPYLYGPWGIEVRKYQPREFLEVSHEFDEPALEPYQLEPVLKKLSEKIAAQLKTKSARRLSLAATVDRLKMPATRLSKEPIKDARQIYRLALLTLSDTHSAGLPIQRLALELSALYRPSKQEALWFAKRRYEEALEVILAHYPDLAVKATLKNPYTLASERMYFWQQVHGGALFEPLPDIAPTWADHHASSGEPYAPAQLENIGAAG
jgi:nucleotidyltransferase/DNA polymerase involved in DNA repair